MKKLLTFKTGFLLLFSLLMILWQVPKANAQKSPDEDETLKISKTIIPVSGDCNKMKVTLTAEGIKVNRPIETVLVLDMSLSMNRTIPGESHPPLYYIKQTAKDFVEKMFLPANNPSGKNKIGLVIYTGKGTIKSQLTNNEQYLKNEIDALVGGGYTNISDGIDKAKEVLENVTAQCNTQRNIIVFTDGVANAKGNPMNQDGCPDNPLEHSPCTLAAMASGQAAQTTTSGEKVSVYSVLLYGGIGYKGNNHWFPQDEIDAMIALARETMEGVQNTGSVYESEKAENLSDLYNDIFEAIKVSAKNITVTDDADYAIESNEVSFNENPDNLTAPVTVSGKNIKWDLEKILLGQKVEFSYIMEVPYPDGCGTHIDNSSSKITYEIFNTSNNQCEPKTLNFPNADYCVPCTNQEIISLTRDGNKVKYKGNITKTHTCADCEVFFHWDFYKNDNLTPFETSAEFSLATQSDKLVGEVDLTNPETTQTIKAVLTSKIKMPNNGCREQSVDKTISALDPVEVDIDKNAVPALDAQGKRIFNTWDLTLTVKTGEGVIFEQVPTDVVLVMDVSSSMEDNNRLTKAKEAAISFVNQMLPDGTATQNMRIALVSYHKQVEVQQSFTNDPDLLIGKINGLTTTNGTFTQGGLHEARMLLQSSTASNKHIVLLTDGVAREQYPIQYPNTHHFKGKNTGNALIDLVIDKAMNNPGSYVYPSSAPAPKNSSKIAKDNLKEDKYNYSGFLETGVLLYESNLGHHPTHYYFPCNAAINEARFAKKKQMTVHTVALDLSMEVGKLTVEKIASPGCFYESTPDELAGVFQTIANTITPVLTNGIVTDVIAPGFVLQDIETSAPVADGDILDHVIVSQGSVDYDASTRKITWNLGNAKPNQTLTLTYRLFLDMTGAHGTPQTNNTSVQGPDVGGFDTNSWAKFNYDDSNTEPQEKYFPRPTVRPMKDSDGDGFSDIYDLDDDNDGILDTNEQGCMDFPAAQSASGTAKTWTDDNFSIFIDGGYDDASGFQKSGFEGKLISDEIPYKRLNGEDDFTVQLGATKKENIVKFEDGFVTYKGTGTFTEPNDLRDVVQNTFVSGNSNTEDAVFLSVDVESVGENDSYAAIIGFKEPVRAFSFDLNDCYDVGIAGDNRDIKLNIFVDGKLMTYLTGKTNYQGTLDLKIYEADGSYKGKVKIGNLVETSFGFVSDVPFSTVKIETISLEGGFKFYDNIGIDNFVYSYDCDTDGDGIVDRLDLDSDADGCPDAIEGDEDVQQEDLENSEMPGGSTDVKENLGNTVGTTDADMGVPTIVNAGGDADIGGDVGQGVGSAQDANNNVCYVKAYNDINQTPEGVSVSGDVSTNDENIAAPNPIVSAQYYDTNGDPQDLQLGNEKTVYSKAKNGAWVKAGTMTLNDDGTYTFDPKAGFTGDVPINYTATNAVGYTDTATLDIKVIPNPGSGNNPPIAQDDTYTVEQGKTATVPVLVNDSDPDGDDLTVKEVKGLDSSGQPTVSLDDTNKDVYVKDPSNPGTYIKAGTAKLVNNEIVFTPEADFIGDVPFDYTIADNGTTGGEGHTDTATATITVLPINGANSVFANDDANTGKKGEMLTGNVKTNDVDPEGDEFGVTKIDINGDGTPDATVNGSELSITAQNGTELGKLTIYANGSYTWKPAADFVGTVVIPYEITDQPNNGSTPATDVATLYLTALPTNCGFLRSNRNVTRQLIK